MPIFVMICPGHAHERMIVQKSGMMCMIVHHGMRVKFMTFCISAYKDYRSILKWAIDRPWKFNVTSLLPFLPKIAGIAPTDGYF